MEVCIIHLYWHGYLHEWLACAEIKLWVAGVKYLAKLVFLLYLKIMHVFPLLSFCFSKHRHIPSVEETYLRATCKMNGKLDVNNWSRGFFYSSVHVFFYCVSTSAFALFTVSSEALSVCITIKHLLSVKTGFTIIYIDTLVFFIHEQLS